MAFSGPMEDRLAIREHYDAYSDATSRGDKAGWLACFATDARWKTHYFELQGEDAISATYDGIMGDVTDTTFFIQLGSIEVDGDTAKVRNQQFESLLYANGSTYDLVGEYHDELIRKDGRWLFKEKIYLVKREKKPDQA